MHEFAYLDESSFLRAGPLARRAGAPLGLAGLSWDGSTTNRPGARFGPRAIRQASHMLCDGIHPHFDCSPVEHLADLGDLLLPNTSLPAMREALAAQLPALLAARHMVWLGGDHSVTLPILRALKQQLGRPLAVIHFDAHCDTWPDDSPDSLNHGTMFYKAVKDGLVDPATSVQIGIRTWNDDFMGMNVIDAPTVHAQGVAATLQQVLSIVGSRPTYLTFDIDCLDPAHAPGTGTPVAGGLSSAQALAIVRGMVPVNLVGMDVVEVSPPFDQSEITALAAAHIACDLLCVLAAQRGAKA